MRTTIFALLLIIYSGLSFGQGNAPITLGSVHKLSSAILGEERTLNIYLPDDYSKTDTAHYPVIYLLDGGTDEDFIHVVGLVQFNSQPWVNRMPKSIVVGIANIDRRKDLAFPTTLKVDKAKYPTTGGSAKFIAYIEQEVMPYINKKFKTNGFKTIIGESLAGVFATEILQTKPKLFDNYIIISPSIWWDNASLLQRKWDLTKQKVNKPTGIYIAVGKEGLAPSEVPHVMEVDANLLKEKIDSFGNKNIHLHFDYLPEEDHATIAHQALLNAFKQLSNTSAHK